MPNDEIILELDGMNYAGWKNVSIQRSMESLCGAFTIQLVDITGTATNDIIEGKSCKVHIKEARTDALTQIINGNIDGVKLKETSNSSSMTVQGRDITADLVDCAAIQPSSTWDKAKFSSIVKAICLPFGIIVDSSQLTTDELIDKFTLQNGETAYQAIERLCRSQAVLPLADLEGNLLLTYAADFTVTADEDLEVGKNIKEIEYEANWKERFSEYTIRGQRSGAGKAWDGRITQMVEQATDLGIDRYRPFVFMSENKATDANLRARVAWEAQVRAGRGTFYNVVVQGWYQTNLITGAKRPWTFNERVNVRAPKWGKDEQQLITAVSFTIDEEGGRKTRLVLKNPDVYAANPSPTVALS